MEKRRNLVVSIVLNALLVVFELYSLYLNHRMGWTYKFQFYTEDSNYFALFAGAVLLLFQLRALFFHKSLPGWVKFLKYTATCGLTITLTVVLLILGPMQGYSAQFAGSLLYKHLLSPLIALVSFLFFEKKPPLPKKAPLYALLPTLFYAAVLIFLNLLGKVDGPYPFLRIRFQPWYLSLLWCGVILGGSYGIGWVIAKGNGGKCHGR